MAAAHDDPVAAAQSLSSPEAQAAFKAALNRVLDSMKSIQGSFDDVKGGLPSIQGTGALQVKWDNLGKQYSKIRWDAKDNATEISTYIEQFGTVQLPIAAGAMGPVPDSDVVATLEQFRGDSAALGQRAKQQVTIFTNLRTELVAFQKDYRAFYDTQSTKQSQKITDLTKEISDLEFQADQINKEIQKVVLEQQGTFLKRNKWMLAIPVLNLVALMMDIIQDNQAKAKLEQLRKQYEELWKQISAKKLELSQAQSTSAAIVKYKVAVDTLTDTRFNDVLSGLDIFSEVWQAADLDVGELIEYKSSGGTKPVPLCLAIFQQTGGSAYTGINVALQAFASAASR